MILLTSGRDQVITIVSGARGTMAGREVKISFSGILSDPEAERPESCVK